MSCHNKLIIALLPMSPVHGDVDANILTVTGMADRLPSGTDILLLPELFSTGYIDNAESARGLAERDDGKTITALCELAARKSVAICGSFLAKNGYMVFNRAFFIEPGGDITFYDKRHLFCLSEESKICKRGISLPPSIRFRGWNISISVCYDLRFPSWLRNTGGGYDLMLIPANWPEKRRYAWETLIMARAIENQAYFAGCNRSGEDKYGVYPADMAFVADFMGRRMDGAALDGLTVVSIDRDSLTRARQSMPFLSDADQVDLKLF